MPRTLRPSTGDSPLEAALTRIIEFAAERQLPVVPGYFDGDDESLPLVIFRDGTSGDSDRPPQDTMRQYLTALQPLDIAMLVVWVDRLDREEWEEAVHACRASIAEGAGGRELDELNDLWDEVHPAPLADDQRGRLEEQLAHTLELEQRLGEIRSLQVRAVTRNPALMIEWWEFAPWSGLISSAAELIDDIDDDSMGMTGAAVAMSPEVQARREEWMARDRERSRWTTAIRTATARRLAELPEFPSAKKEADRIYLLRRMLGDEAPSDDYVTKEIAREALAIYKLEIKTQR